MLAIFTKFQIKFSLKFFHLWSPYSKYTYLQLINYLFPKYPIFLFSLNFIPFLLCRCGPTRVMASSFLRFLDHTQRSTTTGGTPLEEWSARRRDFYLTTHNTHNRQTSKPLAGFEPTISAGERPQTYALERAATGTGKLYSLIYPNFPTEVNIPMRWVM